MTTVIPNIVASECAVSGHTLYQVFRATYMAVDFVLTLVGNTLTIAVTRKVEAFSDSTKLLITSLALADVGTAFVVATSVAAEISGEWIFPDWLCTASFMCFYTFTTVSVFMIIIMTFDRLVAVVRPLRYSLIMTKRRNLTAAGIVWLGCIIGAIATTFTNKVSYNKCSAVCMTAGRNVTLTFVSVLTFYILPLTLIILMNVKLLLIARRHERHLRRCRVAATVPNAPGHPVQPPRSVRGKAVGVTTLVTVAFAVSWSVYQVKLIHGALSVESDVFPEWVDFTAIWLALTNSWWNVLIYSVMNKSFRRHMRAILRRWCP